MTASWADAEDDFGETTVALIDDAVVAAFANVRGQITARRFPEVAEQVTLGVLAALRTHHLTIERTDP